MGGKDHARAAVHTGQLLHRDGVTQGVKTGARRTPWGKECPSQPSLPSFLTASSGNSLFWSIRKCEGLDLLLRKAPDLRAQLFVRRPWF